MPEQARKTKKTLPYTNCIDCPKHRVIPDPDPDDWFNDDDVAVVCTKTPNTERKTGTRFVSDRSEFRTITVACRPYNARNESQTPEWCPLAE